jgi:hypothetical protein
VSEQRQTAVDRLFAETTAVIQRLDSLNEPSLQVAANDNFRKSLLLAAASYFESAICTLIMEYVKEVTGGATLVEEFVRARAVSRHYHTMFNWEGNNANQFFACFGQGFRSLMVKRVNDSDELADSVRAFLEIGNERNRLVHQDYASFPLEKTSDEIYNQYRKALVFVEDLKLALRECGAAGQQQTTG